MFNSLLIAMLNGRKKRPKKFSKFKVCTILLTLLVEIVPNSMHEFWGVSLVCTFREMSLEAFTPIWSHVNESKKKCKIKKSNLNFHIFSTTLAETLPSSMHVFLGMNLLCNFIEDVV